MQIGDLVSITVKDGKIEKWSMELKKGTIDQSMDGTIINGANYDGGDSTKSYFVGTIKKVDTEKDYALIDIGGQEITPKIRCKIYVDNVNNKITHLRMDEFHEGDQVFGYYRYGIVEYLLKN